MAIAIIIYLVGCFISYWMLKVEHVSEGNPYTHGARAVGLLISLLSWLVVLLTLVVAWVIKIKLTGYWAKPINKVNEPS